MGWVIFFIVFFLVVVIGMIRSNQKPADPNCSECGGSGIKKEYGHNVWCDCTYKNGGGLI